MNELMSYGVELMLVGMGIVFLFLTLLVVVINLMSKAILRFSPPPPQTGNVQSAAGNQRVIAAISAAVHQYRKK